MAEDHKPNDTKPGFQQGSAKPGDAQNPDNKQEKLNEQTKEVILSTPSISGHHVFVRSDSHLWRLGE